MQTAITIHRRPYPSDLNNAEWQILELLLAAEKPGGRHRGDTLREIINALQSLIRVGGAWRSRPHDLPHGQSVYHYFRQWTRDGTWLKVHDYLHEEVRKPVATDPCEGAFDHPPRRRTVKRGIGSGATSTG